MKKFLLSIALCCAATNFFVVFRTAVTNVILRKFQGELSRDQQHEKNKLCT